MSLNILTADGLQRIGGVTKEEIITALEYTPANSEVESTVKTHVADDNAHISAEERIAWNAKSDFSGSFHDLDGAPDISDDGSGELHIADGDGNIIARVDAGGIHTTEIEVGGVMLGQAVSEHTEDSNKHISAEERDSWNAKSDFSGAYEDLSGKPNISEDGSLDLKIADEAGNIIAQFDSGGLKTTTVSATSIVVGGVDFVPMIEDHTGNTGIHITDSERESWNKKSDFSGAFADLKDAPNIAEDNAGNMVIADETGNVIFRADAGGIETTTVTATEVVINNEKIGETVVAHGAAIDENKSNIDLVQGDVNDLKELVGEESVAKQITDALDGFEVADGDYNSLENKPITNEGNDKELFIADNAGKVVFRVNEQGIHAPGIFLNGVDIFGVIEAEIDAAVGAAIAAEY